MKKRTKKIITGICILIVFALLSIHFIYNSPLNKEVKAETPDKLTMDQKLEDFEYMYNILKDNHPYFEVKKRIISYDWLKDKEVFKKWVEETKDDLEFYDAIDTALYSIQNGHTHLLYPDEWDEYRRVFKGSNDEWSKVLNKKKVIDRYKLWQKQKNSEEQGTEESLWALPVVFKYIEGYYVACEEDSIVPFDELDIKDGAILLEINSVKVDEYVLNQLDYEELLYDYRRDKLKINQLVVWDRKGSSIKLKLKNPDGKILEKTIDVVPDMDFFYDDLEPELQTEIIKDGSLAYLKVPNFDYLEIEKEGKIIYDFYRKIKDYPYLIIDIRGNSGGSDSYWKNNIVGPLINKEINLDFDFAFRNGNYIEPFIKYISGSEGHLMNIGDLKEGKNYPEELKRDFSSFVKLSMNVKPRRPVGFNGKIFILTDDMVYSSAESFAAFAKESKWATLVGSATGGDGICFDPALFELPNSGLVIRFPVGMGLNSDGTANEEYHTQPDIFLEESYSDYLEKDYEGEKNSDVVLDKVVKMIENKKEH